MADDLERYGRASEWATDKARGAVGHLDAPTPCDEWDVRTLMNHMLDTQRYFAASARGEDAPLPASDPPQVLSDDPVADFRRGSADVLDAYRDPDVRNRMGPSLGVATSDQLLHGWDLARATNQDATMPPDLAQAAYDTINGLFTDDQRPGILKPRVPVPADAPIQDQLLGFSGRDPAGFTSAI